MKIVMIHGQNHKGSTYRLAHMLLDKIKVSDECTEFFLPKDLNHFCTGCCQCIENESSCPFYEDKKKIMDEIKQADVLIFTTPTYCMHASSAMKAFIDLTFTWWMPHKPEESMFRKKAVILTTAAGTGMRSAIKDIKTALTFWGIPEIYSFGLALQASDWEHVAEKKKAKTEKKLDAIAEKINFKKEAIVPMKTKFLFNMMKKMQENGAGASLVEQQYWKQHGWLATNRPWK